MCAGMHECAQVCAGVDGYAWVCVGMRGYMQVCAGVHRCALVCAGICMGVQCVRDEFSEFLLENRVPTSADYNTDPIRILDTHI